MRTWRTREGREIPYDQLEDSHLLAILRMWVRMASQKLAADNTQIIAADWPEEADDERSRLFARDWRSVKAPEWHRDLEALARSRGLDLTDLDAYGRAVQQVAEAAMLGNLRARCGECGHTRVLANVPAEGGHKTLVDALAKKDPLDTYDIGVLCLVLARATVDTRVASGLKDS